MKAVELSARMQALTDMVSKGRTGCDHGWVSIYLVQQGIASKVFAMDVRSGPLDRAKEHICEYQLEPYIEARLSDGLKNLQIGEADCMVCAGMGGPLMMKILKEGRDKAWAMQELILQPQSEIGQFRKFLREERYKTIEENIIYEDGKYYPMMKVIPLVDSKATEAVSEEEQALWDAFGELLLKEKHPVLQQYLEFSVTQVENLLEHLKTQGTIRAEGRVAELKRELCMLRRAQTYK